ncbi:TPA: substrate-binding domain-containing protein [Stenotrophomonas maltophilia]|uniref:substrate-binding domain-containing protein n=1 Tax=Cupriavidus pauculus TaxID=82633 RepID=UPI0007817E44|nr:substrate-binding domain-containing protein [Cupriavidus pauculus]HDS1530715.1 substrate-binding domain-containing protein [Stenotrophomonas maltophilia]
MHDATSQFSKLKLAVAPGVPSSHLSALLALQRLEQPEVTLTFFEVNADVLVAGLHEGLYDVGMTLHEADDPALKSQPLWIEYMAVAVPLRSPLLDQAKLTIAELLDYPVFRWQAESCPLLDQRLSTHPTVSQHSMQHVSSFEMLALKVAAGYGVGISAQSRIERARAWGISMRPLSEGPYEIVTHLQRLNLPATSATERFERRALQVAATS